jgi:hypothetical protein
MWVYAKIAGVSEADPEVSTASSVAAGWAIQTFVYSGVDSAILDSGLRWWANNFATGNAAPPAIRAATDGAWAVAFASSFDDNTLGLLSGSEQGYTLRASNNFNNQSCLAVADKGITSAGDAQTGPTFQQTQRGPDAWIALGQLTLLPSGGTPEMPRLMRQTIGDGSAATTQVTQDFDFSLLEAGDLIEVWMHTNDDDPVITIDDYTLEAHAVGTTTRSCDLFYRIADGSETSIAITNAGGGAAWIYTVQIWRGVDTTTPFDVANTENNAASGTTFTSPSITPVTDGTVVQAMAGSQQAPTTPTFSDAQGFQAAFLERQWGTAASFDSTIFGADKYVATATATTAPTWLAGSATWVGISTALRPAAGAPAEPEGGSDVEVVVVTTGDGTKHASGGSDATVTADTAGAGTKGSQGGSDVICETTTTGSGVKAAQGGSDAEVLVEVTGGGEAPSDDHEGGSATTVEVTVTGAGAKHASGGASVTCTTTTTGAGTKATSGGADAEVIVEVTGGGEIPSTARYREATMSASSKQATASAGAKTATVKAKTREVTLR